MKRAHLVLPGLLLVLAAIPAAAQDLPSDGPALPAPVSVGRPVELRMERARSSSIDLRKLAISGVKKKDRPERPEPPVSRVELPGGAPAAPPPAGPIRTAPAPAPLANFLGLDFLNWGAGRPPDTVGDVGPTYYIQAVNTSVGIFRKSDNVRVAAFTFDTLMSQGSFGNLCDTDNFGDPVVLYDTFEDRWVLTDFAFQLDGTGSVVSPPGAYQCFAVSKTGDPVTGGWNYYSLHLADGLGDYPKLGVWPDGIYMSANMFGFPANSPFMNSRVWALNKTQMYAGAPSVQVVSFDAPSAEFTLLPANARLQAGAPPLGSPNIYSTVWQYLNAISTYKFHVDWDHVSLSTFTGPFLTIAPTSWVSPPSTVPAQGGQPNDTLGIRLMMQSQYTNLGGVESLWTTHTVRNTTLVGVAAVRYYQTVVTGGTVAANTAQAATHGPDAANRYMPSLAVDRASNMALGYSASSSALFPAIRYAGRLSTDPVDTLPQTETSLVEGTGSQNTTNRWGDYSAMSLDPDGCTFWYTNEYFITTGNNWQTRVGSFTNAPAACTTLSSGTVQGTVTASVGGAPIAGATVAFGSRTATTDSAGAYSFPAVPSGSYASIRAAAAGYAPVTSAGVVVTDGATTTQNFSLAASALSACRVDTAQGDFTLGIPSNVDLSTSPGNVVLLDAPVIDQQNTTLSNFGVGITTTTWGGQTFTPGVTGTLEKVDVNLFCAGCSGTAPNLTLSLRATSGNLPTGADIASATIAGFNSGAGGYYTATFAAPPTVTAGTVYAFVVRPTANPSAGTYALTRSATNVYAGGQRVSGATSGTVWSAPLTGTVTTDAGFKVYLKTGFAAAGDFVSSVRDANPATGLIPTWGAFTWTGSTPAGTSLRFQVAASGSEFGPFSFVGPDGTAATYFTTSGASLAAFNGSRYLRYKAYLASTDPTATPTLSDASTCFAAVPPPDLAITKTDGVTSAVPGGSVTYTITASNGGVLAALGATVADTFPSPLTCTWTCVGAGGGTCTASGSGNIADTVNLPASASVTYAASCVIAPAAAGVLSNTATVLFAGDPNPANNSATDTDALTPLPDVGVSVTDGVASALAGGSVTYTIVASNAGPSAAIGAIVADTFPAPLTCTWACIGSGGGSCTASGSGNIADTVNLPPGAAAVYTASCTVASTATGTLSNTATVAVAGDPNSANNSATDSDTLSHVSDLAVTVTDGVAGAIAGGSVTYTIVASNLGPSAATGASVVDAFPAPLTCTWTCAGTGGATCTASGSGAIGDTANLPVGGLATYTASCTVAPTASGTLVNAVTVSIASDPNLFNNMATDTDTIGASADLSVVVSNGSTTANPGGPVGYTIVASNAGPSSVSGATVADTFPAPLTCTWTCAGTAGGTCAASGTGNIADTVNLPAGASVTYSAACTVALSATGSIANSATVLAVGTTDPNPANNASTDTDTLVPLGAAVSGRKTVVGTFAVGTTVTYTVVLANAGPGVQRDNPGDEFTDVLPATLSLLSASASTGTAVANAGTRTVTWNGSIPAGGSVTVTIAASILPSAAGTTVANQGTLSFDGDGNGSNEATAVTDDPGAAGAADATRFAVAETGSIPTLTTLGLVLLGLLQVAVGVAFLRRGGRA